MIATANLLAIAVLGLSASQVDGASTQKYTDILSKNVKNGRVNYKAIAKSETANLDAYLKAVGEAKLPSDRNARIGLYIDAYNAFVIKGIIQAGFPKQVIDVKDFFDKKSYKIGGKSVSLNQLEKKILNRLIYSL